VQHPRLSLTLFLAALVFAGVHTKMAGAAWLMLAATGFHGWWKSKDSLPGPFAPDSAHTQAVRSATGIWLIAALAAILFKAVPMFYWASTWNERHAELRLLIGALGTYGLLFVALPRKFLRWLGLATGVACLGAVVLLVHLGPSATPTNRIPWASGVALLILAALGFSFLRHGLERLLLAVASILGIGAILLLSDVRGAMAVTPIGLVLWLLLSFNEKRAPRRSRSFRGKVAVAATVIGMAVFALTSTTQPLPKTQTRIELAADQAQDFFRNAPDTQNTSVGARLHLWRQSLPEITSNLTWGVGKEQRFALINQWGKELNSHVIQRLGHVHNDYLQTLLEHGFWGLASFLSYALGLLLAARALWHGGLKNQALVIGSIAIMHSIASITNMNFAHNYYPTLLSLSVSITLLGAMLQTHQIQGAS
jgi:O-antigen ligase